jgi:hypothetical protein
MITQRLQYLSEICFNRFPEIYKTMHKPWAGDQIRGKTGRQDSYMYFALLLLLVLTASPLYASGMDGIANAGLILIGLFGAFLLSLITGPLLRQYMAAKYLGINLLQPSPAFGITILEWILWVGSMTCFGIMFPGRLTLPVLLGTVFFISILLNCFAPKCTVDNRPPEIAQRLKYAAAVTLSTFAGIFLVTCVIVRNF